MTQIAFYVEGGGDTAQQKAELRQGFDGLLLSVKSKATAKRLRWKLACAGGRRAAYEAFINAVRTNPDAINVLLVDSEDPVAPETGDPARDAAACVAHLGQRDGWDFSATRPERVHLMVQSMEAWIVADPDALAAYYGQDALRAVLMDNLFGLEIDPRCTQIAAFNLALAAWRLGGYQAPPVLNLACSGLGIYARGEEWVGLAGDDATEQGAMKQLYALFDQAPTLGSLIDPRQIGDDLFVAEFSQVRPLLERALAAERADEAASEMAVTAQGLLVAAWILAGRFTLVATNVPYFGRRKQNDALKDFCARLHPEAKAELATCFVERGLAFCKEGGSVALVTPQNWLTLGTYTGLRQSLLQRAVWNCVVFLGSNAFEIMNWWAATTALVVLGASAPADGWAFAGFDTSGAKAPDEKASHLSCAGPNQHRGMATAEHDGFSSTVIQGPVPVVQSRQLSNADARIVIEAERAQHTLLARYAEAFHGLTTGDTELELTIFAAGRAAGRPGTDDTEPAGHV